MCGKSYRTVVCSHTNINNNLKYKGGTTLPAVFSGVYDFFSGQGYKQGHWLKID